MTSAFFTNESVSLEKQIEVEADTEESEWIQEQIDYFILTSTDWILKNNFKKVCLQFPDQLLKYSSEIALKTKEKLDGASSIYVMADTTYESCCVDYVTAAHVNADSIIHFGAKCFSEATEELPCLYLAPKLDINVHQFTNLCEEEFKDCDKVLIMLDLPYIHLKESLSQLEKLDSKKYTMLTILDKSTRELIKSYPSTFRLVYIGKNDRKMMHLYFMYNPEVLYYFNKSIDKLTTYKPSSRIISRRNFLIEKVKDSNTVGILVGTLAVNHYIQVVERIKKLLKIHKKKYYVIHVGKPTIAKLANFPEIDLYVVITCPMSEIFENRDFYQPLVTPYDVEMALNPSKINHFGFNPTCSAFIEEQIMEPDLEDSSDVSLITGKIRYKSAKEAEEYDDKENNQVACRADGTLVENSHFGAGYLSDRSWKGLEQNLGQTEVTLAKEGTKGIAQQYQNEGT